MAMTQRERDTRRQEKAARMQEEDLRLSVSSGTRKALDCLKRWAGIGETAEALTLMIHHMKALGPGAIRQLLLHEIEGPANVERALPQEELRLKARPGTIKALTALAEWAGSEAGGFISRLIRRLHSMERAHAVKFLTPPRHVIRISSRIAMAFQQKSLLMIKQDAGDEVIAPPFR